jgi:hypothetical protein
MSIKDDNSYKINLTIGFKEWFEEGNDYVKKSQKVLLDGYFEELNEKLQPMVCELIKNKWLEYISNPFFPSFNSEDKRIEKVWTMTEENVEEMYELLESHDWREEEELFWDNIWSNSKGGMGYRDIKNTLFYTLMTLSNSFDGNHEFDMMEWIKDNKPEWLKEEEKITK